MPSQNALCGGGLKNLICGVCARTTFCVYSQSLGWMLSSAPGCVSQTLILRQGPVYVAQVVLKILLPMHSSCYLLLQKDHKNPLGLTLRRPEFRLSSR